MAIELRHRCWFSLGKSVCWDGGVGWKERDEQIIPIKCSIFVDYDSGFGLD